jgi:hypothetical protein
MFREEDVETWCQLLIQAAREQDLDKLAGILTLIETAARAERMRLYNRRNPSRREPPSPTVQTTANETQSWSTQLAGSQESFAESPESVRANSDLYLRYLRLADCALAQELETDQQVHPKKIA